MGYWEAILQQANDYRCNNLGMYFKRDEYVRGADEARIHMPAKKIIKSKGLTGVGVERFLRF